MEQFSNTVVAGIIVGIFIAFFTRFVQRDEHALKHVVMIIMLLIPLPVAYLMEQWFTLTDPLTALQLRDAMRMEAFFTMSWCFPAAAVIWIIYDWLKLLERGMLSAMKRESRERNSYK